MISTQTATRADDDPADAGVRARRRRRRFAPLLVAGLAALAAFAPGPIEGVWTNPLLACCCDAVNRIEFAAGRALVCSDHPELRETIGSYRRTDGTWHWLLGPPGEEQRVTVHPTWLLIRYDDPGTGRTVWGRRILWPPTIREARTQQARPTASDPPR